MEKLNDILEIYLSGQDIKPGTFKASELAELIKSLEESLVCLINKHQPEIDIDTVFISLIGINEGSAVLAFKPSNQAFTSAYHTIADSINKNSYEELPLKSVKNLIAIQEVIKKHDSTLTLRINKSSNGQELESLAQINSDTNIQAPETLYIEGETELYGTVMRVGGVEPKASIKVDEKIFYPKINDLSIAQKVGKYLYKKIGLKVKAIWSIEDYSLQSFEIDDIIEEYEESKIADTIKELSDFMGSEWDDIEDVEKYISDLRKPE